MTKIFRLPLLQTSPCDLVKCNNKLCSMLIQFFIRTYSKDDLFNTTKSLRITHPEASRALIKSYFSNKLPVVQVPTALRYGEAVSNTKSHVPFRFHLRFPGRAPEPIAKKLIRMKQFHKLSFHIETNDLIFY